MVISCFNFLFSQYGGINLEINTHFEVGNQTKDPIEAMLNEAVDTSINELTFSSPEKKPVKIFGYLRLSPTAQVCTSRAAKTCARMLTSL